MKKILFSSLLISGLFAQSITVSSGWQLLGSPEDISVKAFDDSGCVKYLWKYIPSDPNSPWKLHISNGMVNKTSFEDFSTIKAGEGFWANVKENNCSINTDTNTIPKKDYIPKAKDITDRMAIRFLTKATFGASPKSVKHLKEVGFEKWIDEQLSMPKIGNGYAYTRKMFTIATDAFPEKFDKKVDDYIEDKGVLPQPSFFSPWFFRSAWFDFALLAKDQLRHKMAYVLSQIIVESDFEPTFIFRAEALAKYFDILYNNSFGSYKQLLIDISHNSGMSLFLTFVGNKKVYKNEANVSVYPDENYARELMQLFSIGVNKLNMDGTPIKDEKGNLIPTYTQEDVNNIARVFTGWGLRHSPWYGCADEYCGDYIHPTQFFSKYHDFGEKKVLGETIPANLSGDDDIKAVIDILMKQPSVAPFIARHLIMRFTKSNPSPAYIKRVATTFKDNNWDLKKTIKAIFLDPEFMDDLKNNRIIKFKEPLIAYTEYLRQMHVEYPPYIPFSATNVFTHKDASEETYKKLRNTFWFNDPRDYARQGAGAAPNVFNFYDNAYIPNDKKFKDNKLVAPELQIQSETMMIRFNNKIMEDLTHWEKGMMTSMYYKTKDGKVKKYSSLEEFIDEAPRLNNIPVFYVGADKFVIDAKDEYNAIEKVIDGDTNGDFKNLKSGGDYHGDENATWALINFVDKKFLGGMLSEKEKKAVYESIKNDMYCSCWDTGREGKASRQNKIYQIYIHTISKVLRFIVTSDAYMVE